jgi:hypothetical protein
MNPSITFCFLVFSTLAVAVPSAASEQIVFEFVRKHCLRCHDEAEASGDLDLHALQGQATFDESREAWERVVSKLSTGEMPPTDEPRPSAEDVQVVTDWLEAEFLRQDRSIQPVAGRVAARRLNRTEYNNTIRDLLGVDIRPSAEFPADQAAFGFDNISDALRLSPVLTEKYLDAAERAVRTALFGPKMLQPSLTHYPLPVRINLSRGTKSQPKNLFKYDLTGISTVHSAHVVHDFPVDGEYNFRIVLNGHRPTQSEPAHPALFIDGILVQEFEVDATDLEGQIVETRARVAAGERLLSASYLKLYHGLPPQYEGPDPSSRPPGPLLTGEGELNEQDIEVLRRLGTKIKTDLSVETRIDNRFESIDVGGPFEQQNAPSPESWQRVCGCGHGPHEHSANCARSILATFMGRAFRRPATAQEVDAYAHLVELVQEQGDSFDEGIATAFQAVLISPHFLFRIEQDRSPDEGGTSAPVSHYELASRLSYFIWSTMPDAELLQLANENRLRQPEVLAQQVRRMLRDEKSRALVENFAGQWLQFSNIDIIRPDVGQFPTFEDNLRRSMRRETERFLEEIIRKDRSVLEILDADYTFVDERLARFYGIDGVEGSEFRKIDVASTGRGGGLLSHASVLAVTSHSTRTSPVLRGRWILTNLLNAPPPPPPPSVPALDESRIGQSVSLRQEMELHRRDAACASCHARMDPLGFGLENFNAIGEWRARDGEDPIDASGTLPSGRSFQGHQELKQILMEQREVFVRGLAEKLLIYALGRGLERYDRPALAKIAARLPRAGYRFSELVLGIVDSMPFQMRSAVDPETVAAQQREHSP